MENKHHLHHHRGHKANIFTDDGNQIIGTIEAVDDGLVELRNATVYKNFKRRLRNVTIYVVISKINSFRVVEHHDDCCCEEE